MLRAALLLWSPGETAQQEAHNAQIHNASPYHATQRTHSSSCCGCSPLMTSDISQNPAMPAGTSAQPSMFLLPAQYEGPLYDGGDAVLFITHNEQRVRLVKSGPPTPCSPRRISSGRARLPAHPTGSDEQGAGVVPYIPPADPNKQQLFHGPLPVPAASAPGGAAAYTGGMLLQPQQPVMGR